MKVIEMLNNSYDVIIVGAGVAGCLTAMHMPSKFRTLMIDTRKCGSERICGGLLAPDAQKAFNKLNLKIPDNVIVKPEPKFVNAHDFDSGISQKYRRKYKNIDRILFDKWLINRASENVEFHDRTKFLKIDNNVTGFNVTVSNLGEIFQLKSKYIIGADGAKSIVRRSIFLNYPKPAIAIAIQAELESKNPQLNSYEVLFSSIITNFYAWIIPKENRLLVGSAFEKSIGANKKFNALLDFIRRKYKLDGRMLSCSARLITRPARRNELFHGKDCAFLVGEAAGLISPSSGEGISFAVESGAALGKAFQDSNPLATYKKSFCRLTNKITLKFYKSKIIYTPALRRFALRFPFYP